MNWSMNLAHRFQFILALFVIVTTGPGCEQNSSWTIERASRLPTYKMVAYGDSIFAGLVTVEEGDPEYLKIARRAAPYVAGEYLSRKWDANIKVVRRARSGGMAGEVYDKIVAESERMQTSDTRVVMFEMCGSNYLQARKLFREQIGTCNYQELYEALAQCTRHMENAMRHIRDNAYSGVKAKLIMNLYYPAYRADNMLTECRDATTGRPINKQDKFLPILVRSNWRACHLAGQYGFHCVDAFAAMMGADYDSPIYDMDGDGVVETGDGVVDSEALRYVEGESENDYVHRITVTLRATVRDANFHAIADKTLSDYIEGDDTHLTRYGNAVDVGPEGVFNGSHEPDFADSQMADGKNPVWNKRGHERLGWELSNAMPDAP